MPATRSAAACSKQNRGAIPAAAGQVLPNRLPPHKHTAVGLWIAWCSPSGSQEPGKRPTCGCRRRVGGCPAARPRPGQSTPAAPLRREALATGQGTNGGRVRASASIMPLQQVVIRRPAPTASGWSGCAQVDAHEHAGRGVPCSLHQTSSPLQAAAQQLARLPPPSQTHPMWSLVVAGS